MPLSLYPRQCRQMGRLVQGVLGEYLSYTQPASLRHTDCAGQEPHQKNNSDAEPGERSMFETVVSKSCQNRQTYNQFFHMQLNPVPEPRPGSARMRSGVDDHSMPGRGSMWSDVLILRITCVCGH